MIKIFSLGLLGAAGALGAGHFTNLVSCDGCCTAASECTTGEIGSGGGAASVAYLEARDVTVWGGACHISGQAASGGKHALCAWDFGDARVVLAVQGDRNLQGQDVFNSGGDAAVATEAWTDAEDVEAAVARALALASDLPAPASVHSAAVSFERDGDAFALRVEGAIELSGSALPDRECCSMPESRWYAPLSDVPDSIVGQVDRCRVDAEVLADWAFEGENSVFLSAPGS